MQQFTVPQFIDVEDKIIGPITTRQFVIMLAGFTLIGISYKLFDFSLFLTVGILIFAIFGIFAFLKINGMPFHFFVLNFVQTLRKPGLRVWNNALQRIDIGPKEKEAKVMPEISRAPARAYSGSRLAELSLIVDTRGAYKGEEKNNKEALKTNFNNLHGKSDE
jgi:hypothetical protein